jgi:hypothetical protein
MKGLLTCVAVLGLLIAIILYIRRERRIAPPPDPINAAIEGCVQWTRSHSKLKVTEILNEYESSVPDKPHHVLVRLDYRAGSSSIIMHSSCEYLDQGKSVALLSASSSP